MSRFYGRLSKKRLVEFPIKVRVEAYNRALKLKKKGLRPVEIWKLFRKEGLDLKYDTIFSWINGDRNPYGKLNIIKNNGKELINLMRLMLGDGSQYKVIKEDSYVAGRISFGVKDKELAKHFAYLLTYVIARKKPYKPYWSKILGSYFVDAMSKDLVELVTKPFSELKPLIENHSRHFLRGIYDAEGCINIRFTKNRRAYPRIYLTNNNLDLINYLKELLDNLEISSRIKINSKPKYKFIKGKFTSTNKIVYNLCIENIDGVRKFKRLINFTIKRKNKKLNRIVNLIDKYGTDGAYIRLRGC